MNIPLNNKIDLAKFIKLFLIVPNIEAFAFLESLEQSPCGSFSTRDLIYNNYVHSGSAAVIRLVISIGKKPDFLASFNIKLCEQLPCTF